MKEKRSGDKGCGQRFSEKSDNREKGGLWCMVRSKGG